MRPWVKYSLVGWGELKRYCPTPPPKSRPLGSGSRASINGRMDGFTVTVLVGSWPWRAAAVGTDVTPVTPRRSINDSNEAKKKVLSFWIGPPKTPPNWLRLNGGIGLVAGSKKFLASRSELRRNSNSEPCK